MGHPSKYSEEFRSDAVALVLTTEISIAQAGRDLGVNPETLRNWMKQAKIDRGEGPAGALTTAGREELTRLRRRLLELEQERLILLSATVFVAKETTRSTPTWTAALDGTDRVVLRNAVAESWFATLKTEIKTTVWATREQPSADVFRFIAHYNRHRRHSTIDYLTPEQAEQHSRHVELPFAA